MTSIAPEERIEQALRRAHAAGIRVIGAGKTTEGTPFRVTTSATDSSGHHLVVIGGFEFASLSCDCLGSHGACMHKALVWEQLQMLQPAPRLAKKLEVMGARPFAGVLNSR